MNRPNVDERFWLLADSGCHGLLSAIESAELESLLAGNGELCRLYLDYCQLHTDLHFFVGAEQALDTVRARLVDESHAEPASADLPPADLPAQTAVDASPVLGFLATAVHVAASWLSSPKVLAIAVVGGLATYFAGLMISIAISRAYSDQRSAKDQQSEPLAGARRGSSRPPNVGGRIVRPGPILAESCRRARRAWPRESWNSNSTAGPACASKAPPSLHPDRASAWS